MQRSRNMLLLHKICFMIVFREIYTLTDTLHKKNLKLVEILKEDLQRNNDDYAETRRSLTQTNDTQQSYNLDESNKKVNSIPLKESENNKEDVRIKMIDSIRRRVNDALISKEVVNEATDPQRRTGVVHNKRGYNKHRKLDIGRARHLWSDMHDILSKHNELNEYRLNLLLNKTSRLPQKTITTATAKATLTSKTTMFTTNTTATKKKHIKKDKIEKLKEFMKQNKGLLKEFINSEKELTSLGPKIHASQQTPAKKFTITFSGRQLNYLLRKNTNATINKLSLMELPNADMLDMYPAKGGRIHSKRVNGHLCQRHVLIPEGPKYNSKGNMYLPPHAAAHVAHEYNATEIPQLLLPKCCNCCHKSVLGCE